MKNLLFALTVEQENVKIKQKLAWAQQQQEKGLPTIPSTIEEEMETNPFMRVDLPELQVKLITFAVDFVNVRNLHGVFNSLSLARYLPKRVML